MLTILRLLLPPVGLPLPSGHLFPIAINSFLQLEPMSGLRKQLVSAVFHLLSRWENITPILYGDVPQAKTSSFPGSQGLKVSVCLAFLNDALWASLYLEGLPFTGSNREVISCWPHLGWSLCTNHSQEYPHLADLWDLVPLEWHALSLPTDTSP